MTKYLREATYRTRDLFWLMVWGDLVHHGREGIGEQHSLRWWNLIHGLVDQKSLECRLEPEVYNPSRLGSSSQLLLARSQSQGSYKDYH